MDRSQKIEEAPSRAVGRLLTVYETHHRFAATNNANLKVSDVIDRGRIRFLQAAFEKDFLCRTRRALWKVHPLDATSESRIYSQRVLAGERKGDAALGRKKDGQFRLYWTENAQHGAPSTKGVRANSRHRLFGPIEQSLRDVVDRVENIRNHNSVPRRPCMAMRWHRKNRTHF